MKHYFNHSWQHMWCSARHMCVRSAINHAIAWLIHIALDNGITNQPPALQRE